MVDLYSKNDITSIASNKSPINITNM